MSAIRLTCLLGLLPAAQFLLGADLPVEWLGGGHDAGSGSLGAIRALAGSADGHCLATVGPDGTVKLWDSDGHLRKTILAPQTELWGVAVSPNGQFVAAAGSEASWVWRVADRALLLSLPNTAVVAFSPTGTLLAGVGTDAVRVWRIADGALLRTIPGPYSLVRFGRTDNDLLTTDQYGTITRWSLATGYFVWHASHPQVASFDCSGALVASAGGDYLGRLWDYETGALVGTVQHYSGGPPTTLAFSPDGALLATANALLDSPADDTYGEIRIWDVASLTLLRTIDPHGAGAFALTFCHDGEFIFAANWYNSLRLWRVADGSLARECACHAHRVTDVAVARDGQHVVSLSSQWLSDVYTHLGWWNANTGDFISYRKDRGYPQSVAIAPEGALVCVTAQAPDIRLYRTVDFTLVRWLMGETRFTCVAQFSPDGQFLGSGGDDDAVRLWRIETGELLRTLPSGKVYTLAFAPTGTFLAAAGDNQVVQLWTVPAGEPLGVLNGAGGVLLAVGVSADCRYVAGIAALQGPWLTQLLLWRVETGELVATAVDERVMRAIVYSPDGRLLVCGGDDIQIRRASDLFLLRSYRDEAQGVSAVDFFADGTRFAFSRSDATIGVARNPFAPRPGDVNCDGFVTFDDIDPFVVALADPTTYGVQYPECPISNADVNPDGVVDFLDIDPLVALLSR